MPFVKCNRSLFSHLFVQLTLFGKLNFFILLSVPWIFFPATPLPLPVKARCGDLTALHFGPFAVFIPSAPSQMTPNAYSVSLKGCCLVAVLSLPSHLQIVLRTWKGAFLIRFNDKQVGRKECQQWTIETLRTGTRV